MAIFQEIEERILAVKTISSEIKERLSDDLFISRLEYLLDILSTADENLTPPSVLDQLNTQLVNVQNQINSFKSNDDVNQLNSAKTNLFNAMDWSTKLVIVPVSEGKKYISSIQRYANESIGNLKVKVSALEVELAQVKLENSQLIEKFSNLFNVHMMGDGKESKGWVQDFSDFLKEKELVFQKELFGDQDGKGGWVSQAALVQDELESILDDGRNLGRIIDVEEFSKQERKNRQLNFLERIKEKCNLILSKIGLGASIGGYQRRANQESAMSYFWTIVLLGCFFFVVCINGDLVHLYEQKYIQEHFWEFIGFRTLLVSPFIAFMTFAGFKAKNHRKMELTYRQFELELAAFEPNLKGLDENVRAYAKLAFVQKIFGRGDISSSKDADGANSLEELTGFIDGTTKVISSIKEKIR